MSYFPKSTEAFAELEANMSYGFGMQLQSEPRVGLPGLVMADAPFDVTKHHQGMINPLSVMGIALNEPHVTNVLPNRPLQVRLITDMTERAEIGYVSEAKRKAKQSVTEGLEDAVEGSMGNMMLQTVVGGEGRELIEAEDRSEVISVTEDIAVNGLTIVVSDFYGMELGKDSLRGVIAARISHPHEHELPAGIGIIQDGGTNIDTRNRMFGRRNTDLEAFNAEQQAVQSKIDAQLHNSGAFIVRISADLRQEGAIDTSAVDTEFAAALTAYDEL